MRMNESESVAKTVAKNNSYNILLAMGSAHFVLRAYCTTVRTNIVPPFDLMNAMGYSSKKRGDVFTCVYSFYYWIF